MSDENFRDERAFTTAFIEQIALVYTINVMKMLHKLCKNQIHVKPSIMDELVSIQASITVRLAFDRFFIAETKRLSRLLSDWAIQHINKNTSSMHVCFRILDVFLFAHGRGKERFIFPVRLHMGVQMKRVSKLTDAILGYNYAFASAENSASSFGSCSAIVSSLNWHVPTFL